MIFHENRLLADDSHVNIIPYFCRKLGKMTQNFASAAVMIGALRVKETNLLSLLFIRTAPIYRVYSIQYNNVEN